ncbi:MAG: hypothetical protein R2911_34320 [Caldilineaceae bacterium]
MDAFAFVEELDGRGNVGGVEGGKGDGRGGVKVAVGGVEVEGDEGDEEKGRRGEKGKGRRGVDERFCSGFQHPQNERAATQRLGQT